MEIFDRITGKTLEDKVAEYSEVYGEVLLGLHRDVEGQHQSLLDTREEFNSRANEINKHLITQAKEIRRLKCFCFGSYLVALIIAVVVWLSR